MSSAAVIPSGKPPTRSHSFFRKAWEAPGGVYAITYRLADSLPQEAIDHHRQERFDVGYRLGEKADVQISFYATTSYSAVIEAMLSGFVQIAQLGPKAYLIANEKSKGRIQPIVAAARIPTAFDPTPCACYYGTLITKKGSGLDSIGKLKKKVLALVDPGSTSGNAMPRGLFTVEKLNGNPLESHFGRIFYSGHHVASVMAVKKGKADAAFVSESMIARAMDHTSAKRIVRHMPR